MRKFKFRLGRLLFCILTLAVLILLIIVALNILLIYSCELLNLSRAGFRGSTGLFTFSLPGDDADGDECVAISDISDRAIEDKALKCARVSVIMALSFGGLVFIFGFFKQCIIPLPCSQRIIDLSSTCVQICLGLVYVIWWSDLCDDFYCTYGDGATYLICTQCLWLIAGIFSRCMRDGRWERRDEIREARERKKAEQEQQRQEDEAAQEPSVEVEHGGAEDYAAGGTPSWTNT